MTQWKECNIYKWITHQLCTVWDFHHTYSYFQYERKRIELISWNDKAYFRIFQKNSVRQTMNNARGLQCFKWRMKNKVVLPVVTIRCTITQVLNRYTVAVTWTSEWFIRMASIWKFKSTHKLSEFLLLVIQTLMKGMRLVTGTIS